jgi:hypothetical protein
LLLVSSAEILAFLPCGVEIKRCNCLVYVTPIQKAQKNAKRILG